MKYEYYLNTGGGNNEIREEVSEVYISNIKAKLAVLNNLVG